MNKTQVFISHSSKDKKFATFLAKELRSRNLSVWIDHERIKYGESIPAAIEIGLAESDCIIIIVSSAFLASKWTRAEYEPLLIKEIDRDEVLIIPILIEDVQLPLLLSRKRYVDLRQSKKNSAVLDELSKQIISSRLKDGNTSKKRQVRTRRVAPAPNSPPGIVLKKALDVLSPENLLKSAPAVTNPQVGKQLLEEVTRLVELFEIYFDEIVSQIIKTKESWDYLEPNQQHFLKANRKLVNIYNEMRSVYQRVNERFSLSPEVKETIDRITSICAQLEDAEGIMIINLYRHAGPLKFTVDESIREDDLGYFGSLLNAKGKEIKKRPYQVTYEMEEVERDDPEFQDYLKDYNLALIKLHNYRIRLKEAIEDLNRI